MTYHCTDCGSEFISERSVPCLQCGSPNTCPVEENTTEGLSASHAEETQEVIRDILTELCVEAYESPYMGIEWEEAIDRAFEKLEPYFKEGATNTSGKEG